MTRLWRKMAKYKLTYFALRGRAEITRYLFAFAGVPYDDVRIDPAKWTQEKKKYPYGQLPVLQINNGPLIPQSPAINRFLAAEFDLFGSTNEDRLRIDVVFEIVQELLLKIMAVKYEKDKTIRADGNYLLKEETIPFYLKRLDVVLESSKEGGGYFVGNKLSLADLYFFNVIYDVMQPLHQVNLDQYVKAKELIEKVKEIPAIAEWIQKRPKTDF